MESARARAVAAIDRRLETIDGLQTAVTTNPHVSGAHRGDLLGGLGSDRAGLTALRAGIESTDDRAGLLDMAMAIATEYRVFLVVRPTVIGVLASDTGVALADRGRDRLAVLISWTARAESAGFDVDRPRSLLDAASDQLDRVSTLAGPVADRLLALVAGDWPDPAAQVIDDGFGSLREARRAGREAVDDAGAAVAALRGILRRAA